MNNKIKKIYSLWCLKNHMPLKTALQSSIRSELLNKDLSYSNLMYVRESSLATTYMVQAYLELMPLLNVYAYFGSEEQEEKSRLLRGIIDKLI